MRAVRECAEVRAAWALRIRARREIATRLADLQGGVCALCWHPFTATRPPTLDHIYPKARGGPTVASNLQAAHAECNKIKGELTMEQVDRRVANGWLRWPEPEPPATPLLLDRAHETPRVDQRG